MKYLLIFLMMCSACSVCFGYRSRYNGDLPNLSAQKILTAKPTDNLHSIYNRTDGWNLGADEWGVIYLMPGTYDLGTTKLEIDNERVKLIGIGRVVITTSATTNDWLAEITAYAYGFENIEFRVTENCKAVHFNSTEEGGISVSSRTITLDSSFAGVKAGDWIWCYTDGTADGKWFPVIDVDGDDIKSDGRDVSASYDKAEMVGVEQCQIKDCKFDTTDEDIFLYVDAGAIYSKNLGGTWTNCTFGNNCFGCIAAGTGWDVVGVFHKITAGWKFIALDIGNNTFNGRITDFHTKANFLSCTRWSGKLGPDAYVANGICGDVSVVIGGTIGVGAYVANVVAGIRSFAGESDSPLEENNGVRTAVDSGTTDGVGSFKLIESGQNFTSTVTIGDTVHNTPNFTDALVTAIDSDTTLSLDTDIMISGKAYTIYSSSVTWSGANFLPEALYGGQQGRPGRVVWLDGTNVNDDYYEVDSVDYDNDIVTFTASPATVPSTDIDMYINVGQIAGTVLNCYADDDNSYATLNTTPDVANPFSILSGGKILGCYTDDTERNITP